MRIRLPSIDASMPKPRKLRKSFAEIRDNCCLSASATIARASGCVENCATDAASRRSSSSLCESNERDPRDNERASWALKSEGPVPVEHCARYSLDTDDPSGRNCSWRQSRFRGSGPSRALRFATVAWGVWLRRATKELFSSVLLFLLQAMAVTLAALGLDWLLLCINCLASNGHTHETTD